MPATALVVDDEADVVNLVVHHLQKSGLRTLAAHDGATALELARREHPGVIVLDLMLPGMSGLEICRALRRDPATAGVGIVMLTARGEGGDKVEGFETGADDYVTKPFSPRELVLRVQAVLRRADAAREGAAMIETGDLRLNKGAFDARLAGRRLDLTTTEFKLLCVLVERRGRVQDRDTLLRDVWGYEGLMDTRTVDTHVRRLREKLGEAADRIETLRGEGYRYAG